MQLCGIKAWVKSSHSLFKHMLKGLSYVSEHKNLVEFGDEMEHIVEYDVNNDETIKVDGVSSNKQGVNHNDVMVYENNILISKNKKYNFCVILIQVQDTEDNSPSSQLAFLLNDRLNTIRIKQKYARKEQDGYIKQKPAKKVVPPQEYQHHEEQQVQEQPTVEQPVAVSGNDLDQSQNQQQPHPEPQSEPQQASEPHPEPVQQQAQQVAEPAGFDSPAQNEDKQEEQPNQQELYEAVAVTEPVIEQAPEAAKEDQDAGFD